MSIRLALAATAVLAGLAMFVLYPLSRQLSSREAGAMATPLASLGNLPSFRFTTHLGETITNESVSGDVVVIGFFFTSCRGVCPALTSAMRRLDAEFRGATRLRLLQISVDPKYDTIERLAEFAKESGADGKRWLFLRGEEGEASRFAREGLKLGATEVPGDILHSDRFVLVGPNGEIRGYFKPTDPEDYDRLVAGIRGLLAEVGGL